MAILFTIPITISVGYISTYLSANDNANGGIFGRRVSAPKSPVEMLMDTDALNWAYNNGVNSTPNMRHTANYCRWEYGVYGQQAQYIISGTGGGSVIPFFAGTVASALDFVVSTTSVIPTNGSTVILTQFIGFDVDFFRAGVVQYQTDNGGSWYSWNKLNGQFIMIPNAQEDESLRISPSI